MFKSDSTASCEKKLCVRCRPCFDRSLQRGSRRERAHLPGREPVAAPAQ